ncbi:MAG: hypothetical protein FWG49_06440, partial [Leptospirales bacterium]|nr:hypothetical protein [Leptospirales bacterium]
ADCLDISAAQLFCKENENINENEIIYNDRLLKKFDGITEKHLVRAIKGIKREIRQEGAEE